MVKIAYLLLCHKDPDAIIRQALRLTACGDFVAIHFDARGRDRDFERLKAALCDIDAVTFARRVKCGWGEWSLVQATLNATRAAIASFPRATHFYMVSGDCMPIKSAAFAHDFLAARNCDYIESFDYFDSGWIKTGMREERLFYRHFVNERKHKSLFYASLEAQKRLGLRRKIPGDLKIMVGSQWWCLRRSTIEAVLDFLDRRGDVTRFFRRTWIPDETVFQTLVRHLVPHAEIDPRTLTFLMFSDYGMPVTFYDDQYDLLLAQDFLFARKISPEAQQLKQRLGKLYASGRREYSLSNEGRQLYRYLTRQGRHGRRFAPRFWERESTLGRDRELLILICKKRDVARRLLASIRHATNLHGVEFLFDETDAGLPHLGGIESAMEKRTRHRRAMMRLLYEYYETDRLVICLDPDNIDILRDFHTDRCTTRILEIECKYEDTFLFEHAKRTGLAGPDTPVDRLQELVPALKREFDHQIDRLKDARFPNYYSISEQKSDRENMVPIAAFLGISEHIAGEIARTGHLFAE